nr:MAG TPA: hypothetical protein [Caudoviricetes sp.]
MKNFTPILTNSEELDTQIVKYLSEYIKGDIEVLVTTNKIYIYVTNNQYCFNVFFNYTINKTHTTLKTLQWDLNDFFKAYKDWICEKLFY